MGGAGAPLGSSKDPKAVVSSEAGVVRSVLATLGALASQAGTGFKPYVGEVMPLVIEAIQVRVHMGVHVLCIYVCSFGFTADVMANDEICPGQCFNVLFLLEEHQ